MRAIVPGGCRFGCWFVSIRPSRCTILLPESHSTTTHHGGDMRTLRILLAVAVSLVLTTSFAAAQEKTMGKMTHKKAELSDAQYTPKALSAAPKGVAKDAGVARF